MNKAIFYHAGCPVCISAEQQIVEGLDKNKYNVEIIHLGENKNQIALAEKIGVESVPALLLDGNLFHINFGASINDLKGA